MSYILDALNRSNAESVQDPRALLAAQTPPSRRGPVVPVLLTALLTVNVGLGAWWLWQNQEAAPLPAPQTDPPAASPTASPPPIPTAREVQRDSPPVQSPSSAVPARAPAPRTAAVPSPEPAARPPAPTTALAPEEELITPEPARKPRPVPIGALPRGVQEQIPDLAFSSHIYAEDPALRMVNINGELYRQGDTIARGVKLLEITEEGAVLAYLHYTFEVGVLEDWTL